VPYTYRAGVRVELDKKDDEFVVRTTPEALREHGIADDAERVSPSASRVGSTPEELEATMARSRAIAPTYHAYTVGESGADFIVTDRVFVTFERAAGADGIAKLTGRYSLLHLRAYSATDHLFQLTDATAMNPVRLVVKLVEDEPLVASAENDLNYLAKKAVFALPTDIEYARQWHLHAVADTGVDGRANARVEEAWQLLEGFGSADIVVGITDDGCRLDHGDFDSPGKFTGYGYFEGTRLVRDFDVDAQPSRMYQRDANHGTSCASMIAGEVDRASTVGAAPGCRLLPIKWESEGPSLLVSDSKLLTALDFVADRIDVLSNSWGMVPTSLFATPVVNRIRELAQTGGRRGRGILFLWAMGNDNCPIQHTANVDVPYDSGWVQQPNGAVGWVGVSTARVFRNNLADVPGVLHVAALASTAQRAHYSNYGTGVSLTAPAGNWHAYWRMQLPGLGVATTTDSSVLVRHPFGTSSATPLVASVAALTISANPALSAIEVASILRRTASHSLSTDGWPRTPPSAVDPDTSWDISPIPPFDRGDFQDLGHSDGPWSPWFGHGRVDALAAVSAAYESAVTPPPALIGRRHGRSSKALPASGAELSRAPAAKTTTPPSGPVFVSYRRHDSSDVTGRIYDSLTHRFGRDAVFKDVDSIPLGVDFRQVLTAKLANCYVFLAVIGPKWAGASKRRPLDNVNDFVRIELEAAFQRGIPIIPVLVQGAHIPSPDRLPPSLQPLAYRNGILVRPDPDFHTDVERLVRGIEAYLPKGGART
jgi:subtilisin family serine protease